MSVAALDLSQARRIAASFTWADADADFVADPYPTYAALRAHDPVHALAPDTWLLTRHDDVGALYRQGSASSDKQREFGARMDAGSPILEHHTTSMVFNDPPLHTRLRRPILGAVNQRAVARITPALEALVDILLDRMAELPAPDLIEDFAAQIPVEVIGNLLNVPHSQRAPLRGWSLAILSALEPFSTATMLASADAAVRDFLALLRDVVADRRQHPGDPDADVLTRLIQGEAGGERLSEAELLHNCIFLLNAGHETTTNLLGNGVHALLSHRDQWDRLVAEPGLAASAVEELLRFESPLQLNNRVLTAPLRVRERLLPAGDFVNLCIGAANRDPAVFEQPDQLDISRKPNPHLAFGHGSHACAGMNVARLEGRVALARLARRYPKLALAGPPERDLRIRFRGFRRVPVQLG